MKKFVFLLAVSVIIFSAAGCRKKETAQLLVPEHYTDWAITADHLNYPIPGHESHYRRIFINPTGEKVTTEKKNGRLFYTYPKGTVIIKEIYPTLTPAKDTKPISLSVMIKDPENPKARDGWVWIIKDLKKNTEKIIDYEFCFDCHTNANEPHPYGDGNPQGDFRDYVFFPYKKKQ